MFFYRPSTFCINYSKCAFNLFSQRVKPFAVTGKFFCESKKESDTDAATQTPAATPAATPKLQTLFGNSRNFVTPVRAMTEYLLEPKDLEGLRTVKRRSPYQNTPPIIVHFRMDVEKRAVEIWGSLDHVKKKQHDLRVKSVYFDGIHHHKYAQEVKLSQLGPDHEDNQEEKLRGTKNVVMTAIAINAANFVVKGVAWYITSSHSMFAEVIHSFADTFNQIILYYGIKLSTQRANFTHPYGFHTLRYVSSLISGVGIFFCGAGLSVYHGLSGLWHPSEPDPLFWAFIVLGGSFLSEGGTLFLALNTLKKAASKKKITVLEYVMSGQDPSVNVVLLEDLGAVFGIVIAGASIGLTSLLNNPVFDAVGSILIGGVLGCVATFIIYTNSTALIGQSISAQRIVEMNTRLEKDHMIRAIHDVKATEMGNSFVHYKAEIDFDGREVTNNYIMNQDLKSMLEEIKSLATEDEVKEFVLKHGENIVDQIGAEVDRIEKLLKKDFPELRHVDLEIL